MTDKPFIATSIKEALEEMKRKVNCNDNQVIIIDEGIEQKGMSKCGVSINDILKQQREVLNNLKKTKPNSRFLEEKKNV